tara:strand:- start:1061 stop:1336 length:276 start_codon:yes stop_codon:yes gene_type:complete
MRVAAVWPKNLKRAVIPLDTKVNHAFGVNVDFTMEIADVLPVSGWFEPARNMNVRFSLNWKRQKKESDERERSALHGGENSEEADTGKAII